MNRFQDKRTRNYSSAGLFFSVLLMAVFFAIILGEIRNVEENVRKKELEHLEQVLNQSAAVCYALEGDYPESLSYLKEHYGVSWDEKRYLVDFETVGSNLPPDIVVLPKKGEEN